MVGVFFSGKGYFSSQVRGSFVCAWLGDEAEDKAEREKTGERRDGESRHPCPGWGAHGGGGGPCPRGYRPSAVGSAGIGKLSAERSSGDADVRAARRPNGESVRDGR